MNRITVSMATALMALSLGACATGNGYDRGYASSGSSPYYTNSRCNTCGTVERIDVARRGTAANSGAGAVAGAIVGGVLGNQVGSGDGRRAATVVGAVAGGVAGNSIERNVRDREIYELSVRMDDGRRVVVEQSNLNGVREGSRVLVSNGRARLM